MRNDHCRYHVNGVVGMRHDHHEEGVGAGEQGDVRPAVPACCPEFEELNGAEADVARIPEIVCLAIGHKDRWKSWVVPDESRLWKRKAAEALDEGPRCVESGTDGKESEGGSLRYDPHSLRQHDQINEPAARDNQDIV